MVSRSRASRGAARRGGAGSSWTIFSIVSCWLAPRYGKRPVSNSYRMTPRAWPSVGGPTPWPALLKGAARAQFQAEERAPRDRADVVDAHDAVVLQVRHGFGLAEQPLRLAALARLGWGQGLQRDLALQLLVEGQPDRPHAAAA